MIGHAHPFADKGKEGKPNPGLKASAVKRKVEENSLNCVTNCQKPVVKAEPFLDEQINTPRGLEDVEVDIVSWTNKGEFSSNQNEDPDATEYSSSFADTTSDTEMCSKSSEAEVESEFLGDDGLPCTFDAFGSAISTRKKKLTDHWRNFIRPLMWRCKWTELRIREIQSQALKYSRELADYDRWKSTRPDHFTLEECGSKALPFPSHQYRPKIKKRKKRKKVEETTDIKSYMSRHFLFSYLENKKSDPDGFLADDFGNPGAVKVELHADSTDRFGIDDDQSFFEFGDGDISTEQLLWTIETVQSRVHKLRSQVDTVMPKNASKFSSSENLSLPHGDVQTSSAHSPTFSAVNGDTVSVGAIYNSAQQVPEFDLGDLGVPDSAVLSYGGATSIPDIIESTVGLLSAADVTLRQPQAGDLREHMVENVLIHNEASEKGEQGESADPAAIMTTESSIPAKSAMSQDQSALRSCLYNDVHFPRIKRKRGERKAGSGSWNMKGSGEPDSQ